MPRTVHFVFGLREQDVPFHLVHHLAVASCLAVVEPDEVVVHCHELPYGFYWDLIRQRVTLRRVERPAISAHRYEDPAVARYRYAHEADVVRLDVLVELGGMYADIDTLFVAPPPEELWRLPCTMGREADVVDPRIGRSRTSVSNALIMAEPGASFVKRWREQIDSAFDGSWSAHSCLLADDLARAHPDEVHIEPERTFHAFAPTPEGLHRLLVDRVLGLAGVSSIHLAAHLWWDEDRRDFVRDVHAGMIDERFIRERASTYAAAAARFLPEHGCF